MGFEKGVISIIGGNKGGLDQSKRPVGLMRPTHPLKRRECSRIFKRAKEMNSYMCGQETDMF
jgi:hypothetical protein